jgi:hypothetical protein
VSESISATVLLFTLLVSGVPATGDPAAPTYVIRGAGADSCGDWNQYKLTDDPARYGSISWVLGYISAFNNFVSADGDLGAHASVDEITAWIDEYCKAKPLDTVAGATTALISRLAAPGAAVHR